MGNALRSLGIVLIGMCVFGGLYPLLLVGIGRLVFPFTSQGSLIVEEGEKKGSALIAQPFTDSGYLFPRPSAAGEFGYDGGASSGSNLAITSLEWMRLVKARSSEYRLINQIPPEMQIPIDAVTASGSGLDPEISLENALLQAKRVASTRHISERQVRSIIREKSIHSPFDRLSQRRVNVLECNMAIDRFHQFTLFRDDYSRED